jgi:CheY-like chemotaxis protein
VSKSTVLIVEDDHDLRDDLAFILRAKGYSVIAAENGSIALAKLKASRPDIVLLDLMMPVMNGWELRTKMLEDPALRQLPTVILTGVASPHETVKAMQASGYLAKPFDTSKLLETIERFCAKQA